MTGLPSSLRAGPSSSPDQPLCLRLYDALELLGIGKTKMYQLIAAGEIEAIKVGRSTLILRKSLEAYVERAPRL